MVEQAVEPSQSMNNAEMIADLERRMARVLLYGLEGHTYAHISLGDSGASNADFQEMLDPIGDVWKSAFAMIRTIVREIDVFMKIRGYRRCLDAWCYLHDDSGIL